MKADYRNWMPKGMVAGFARAAGVFLILGILFAVLPITGPAKKILASVLLSIAALLLIASCWMFLMYRAFSYDGKRQMSKQIIEGVASYVDIPDGGKYAEFVKIRQEAENWQIA